MKIKDKTLPHIIKPLLSKGSTHIMALAVLCTAILACKNESTEKSEETRALSTEQIFSSSKWLTYERELPKTDSLFYLEHPAPIFRKEFETKDDISQAKLFITSAGYYLGTINGEPIGKNVLDPAWTDYTKRTYFTEYDLTEQLRKGANCLGVGLGNGFYNPLPLKKWGRRNPRTDLNVGKPTFIATLIIYYKDGSKDTIVTDPTWKYTYGPILKNSVYLGTVYDANKEIKNWNLADFDDTSWLSPEISDGPGGMLQKAISPPVQVTQTIKPIAVTEPEKGTFVVDMGVNFTGTYKIKLREQPGDTITFRFGERIYEDGTLNPMTTVIGQVKKKGVGGPGSPEIAWQTDSFIMGDTSPAIFEPAFTYHVYRYMEIKGLKKAPDLNDITGLLMGSNVADAGEFTSSSETLNSIQEITERAFLTNIVSVQSDCAAREKFGYGGDLNATSEAFINNFDMKNFYRKTIYDWIDAMKDDKFVDTAPFAGVQYCGISWESAYITTQYYNYLYYNDIALVKELYQNNLKWMDKVARIHPEGMVDKGLSDHESMLPVPVQLTGTAHYKQCAEIMKTFAEVMGDEDNAAKFDSLAQDLKQQIKAKYWDQWVTGKINRQTLFSTLLYHDIVPQEELEAAKDSLQNAIENGPSKHFSTGIFGTKYALETVSEHISTQAVFDIVNSTVFPGWGFMVENGATTLWETWEESDNVFSNNHPMFGSVTEWFYRWLGGIRPDPKSPGFKNFVLAPRAPKGLEYVNTSYKSPFGTIVSNWKRESNKTITYELTIPKSSSASVHFEKSENETISILKDGKNLDNSDIEGIETGRFQLDEGAYVIEITP